VRACQDFTKPRLRGYTIQRISVIEMAPRFEELIEHHHDEIFAYLWRLMGNGGRRDGAMDVEDLAQDVFLRAYRSFATLRPNSNHRAWLYKIATNCAYTRLRQTKKHRDKLSSLQHPATGRETAGDISSARKDMEQRVRALVNGLPAKQKACVTLRYLQDLDYPEIAEILGCSQESARANVSQAIRRLRNVLEEEK
jgi:RNA polymerase sigma-70 factor, ECF subfamily